MENIIIISLLSTFLCCLVKLVEMKFMVPSVGGGGGDDGDEYSGVGGGGKPLKFLIRDALIVFICTMASTYVYFHVDTNVMNLLHIITETKTTPQVGASEVFAGQPDF